MGFQLTIAEGKDAGKEFVFEQANVVIGRTSDCDVVLYDPGVSRKHARVSVEGDDVFVEDLGSSNGTKVNGGVVKKHQLKENDRITLGPVTFVFLPTALPEAPALGEGGEQSTRIVSVDQVKRQRNKGVALVPQGAAPEQLSQLARSRTTAMPAIARPRTATSNALAPRTSSSPGGEAAASRNALSAAERARIRRQSKGKSADLKIWWAEADEKKRKSVMLGGGALGLLIVAGLGYAFFAQQDTGPKEEEISVLTGRPLAQSFGLHPAAQFERADAKKFTFSFTSAVRTVAILHYQAEAISQNEVMLTINGTDVQALDPDTLNSAERSVEIVIPATLIKKGEENTVVFDNTLNPPGEEQWRIWNVWLEMVPLPELPPEQLMREAQTNFERGKLLLDRIDIGAPNRYEAWKNLRQSWLMLETNPTLNKDLHELSRFMMNRAQQELDKKCSQLLRDIDRYASLRDWESARSTLDHVKAFFPGIDQPCPYVAEERGARYGL